MISNLDSYVSVTENGKVVIEDEKNAFVKTIEKDVARLNVMGGISITQIEIIRRPINRNISDIPGKYRWIYCPGYGTKT